MVDANKLSVADVTTLKRVCKESKHKTHTGSNPVLTTNQLKLNNMTAKSMTHQEILDIFPKEYNVTINGMVLSIYSPTYIGIILDDTVIIENKKDWIDIKTKGSSMTFFKSSCPNSHITIH